MDFPKNVPDAGLVGGRFIDENVVTGQQGSLLAAQWGNQLTDEILNVIALAHADDEENPDFIPSETQSNQMALAIQKLIADATAGISNDWANLKDKPLALTSLLNITTITATTTLTNAQLGVVLIDASASDIAITLPLANTDNKAVKVTLCRLDHSANKVTVKAATGEAVLFNTRWNASGYGFFYLMGAGDYWQIVSNGSKGWFKFGCYDNSSLGGLIFDTSINIPAGGFILGSGSLLSRSEYPWLWDYAQQSGLLVDDSSRTGFEGSWTNGDGVATFRTPDLRGEFLRVLDEGRGIDIDRVAGSWQVDDFKSHTHNITPMSAENAVTNLGIVAWSSRREVTKTTEATGGDETRPRNIAYPLYIKII